MATVVCAPVFCQCGNRMVWRADAAWLAKEGFAIPSDPRRSAAPAAAPKDASDVTGMFNRRCPACFENLSILGLLRARLAAGAGLMVELPSEAGRPAPGTAEPDVSEGSGWGTPLTTQDRRRTRRARAEAVPEGFVTTTFKATIVDVSQGGIAVEHLHEVQVGQRYTVKLRLPTHPGALPVEGRAVWTRSHRLDQSRAGRRTVYRTGFEVVHLPPESAAALEDYVADAFRRGARADP